MIIIDQNFSFSLQKRASTKYCGGTTILFSRHHWNSIMLIVNSNGDTSLEKRHSNFHLSWSSLTITCLILPDNGLAPLLDVAQDHPGQAPPLLTSRARRSRAGQQASTLLCNCCRVSPSPQTLLRPILPLTTLPLPVHHGLGDAEDIVGGVAAHGLEEGGGVAPLEKVRSRAGSPCPTSTIASILHPPTPALYHSTHGGIFHYSSLTFLSIPASVAAHTDQRRPPSHHNQELLFPGIWFWRRINNIFWRPISLLWTNWPPLGQTNLHSCARVWFVSAFLPCTRSRSSSSHICL